ncbi:acyltransferase family protein [Azohydromonas aeria]|uniref:acyltransferase family protein n=1 Tax=Azohydromonas aeria TaxID=2590212 RepID=UPI0012FA2F26|nr:acyltransferase family protein [Azohydromonas aeria]
MNQNILKGLLIIGVVIDHNDFSRSLFSGFLLGFSFHVVGFMTLPFLRELPRLSRSYVLGNFFRLYYPFFLLTLALGAVVAMGAPTGLYESARRLLAALYSGNSEVLKQTTHMALLWFLPSMFSLTLILGLLASCRRPVAIVLLCAIVASHFFIGTVAADVQHYLPLGLLPALYVIPLAALIALLQKGFFERLQIWPALLLASIAFAVAKYGQMQQGLYQEVGFSLVADYRDLWALALNDMEAVSGTLLMMQLARLPLGRFVETCGKYSMQVYILHGFIGFGCYRLLVWLNPGWPVSVKFAMSLACTVGASLVLARLAMDHDTVRRFAFPRSWADLAGPRAGRVPARASM